jgi:putative molybdopterin biosynthesis protein
MKNESVYIKNQPLSAAKKIWKKALIDCGFFTSCRSEVINVDHSVGKLTAKPVFAQHSSPTYNASAMDGIAVHFLDLSSASEAHPVILDPLKYKRVNTGNAIPDIYNAVVMIEDVHTHNNGDVEFINPATPWQHIRTVGEDIVATELIIPEGHVIRPIDQGAMLAAGISEVETRVPPRVSVIPTGSELIPPGQPVKPGQIIEFNTRILTGYLRQWGADAHAQEPVMDDPEKLKEAIEQATATSDIVFTNAGASAGTKDFSAKILNSLGKIIVHGVAIKPGKPVILALVNGTPVIGLPGYPISALLTMKLFGEELIHEFLGLKTPSKEFIDAVMSRPMHSSMGVDQFVRVTLGQVDDKLIATPSGKGAGAVMSMVRADGLLTIPAGSEGVGAGERISIELLRPKSEIDATLVSIGSHDNILDLLANQLYKNSPRIRLSSAHVGSMGGIMAIRRGEAHIAGTHLLDEDTGEYNISFIKRFLKDIPLQLINLCYREQGLIIQKNNPCGISSFNDIADKKLSFINRQKGAGTRLLTDKILSDAKINPSRISGYDHEEYTHMSVAAAVASGSVDAGMGIRAAAVALDLDFIPIAEERYDLIVPGHLLSDQRVVSALEIIRENREFYAKVIALGGYNLRDSGSVVYCQ